MNTRDFGDVLYKVFSRSKRQIVVLAQGPPGVGKTAIVAQAAKLTNKPLLTFALPTCEAVDLRGLPRVVDGRTQWASPMPRDGEGIILLDELSSAPPDVQVAAHHLVWAEEGSDMSLPSGWHIVLTGNRASDKTLYRGISAPLRNRMTIVEVEAEPSQWTEWAMSNKIASEIVGFIRWRPELLTSKEIPNDGAFPSPRAWEKANDIISLEVSQKVERMMLAGTIGEGPTTEFVAYLRTARELPSIQAILANPKKAEVPSSPSLLYALTTALAQFTREKLESAMPYVERLPSEFTFRYILDVRDHYAIREDKDIRNWIANHKSMFRTEDER
jgi:MoxR-like ATPase